MKYQKIMRRMMGCAAAILALTACSESEDLLSAFHSDPNAVRITAQVGKASADGFTRSNPLGDAETQKNFNDGDMISVKADGQDAVTYQLNNNEWQPQGSKFLKWESNEMNFTAYYPATFDGNLDKVTLPKEYDEASLAANDFMSYTGKQSNTNGNQLSLIMERKMARVVVMIDGFKDQYAGATIDNVNSLSICGVKAFKHSDNKFYALIKPCEAQNSETFISLDVAEGASKTTETLAGIPALTAGNSYTYQLTVGKNKVSVSGITVANWNTGTIINDGKTEQIFPYVTFKANGEQKFKMTTEGSYTISGLQYSVNNGKWENVVVDKEVTFGGTNGDLRLRGTNINGTASEWYARSTIKFTEANVNVACTGDIRTLLDWRNYNIVETNKAKFCSLFKDCSVLTTAPELPATKLAEHCYASMFSGCTSLTSAPKLPAIELAKFCYRYMFFGCTSLTAASELPATKLAGDCYNYMFSGCTSLTSAPKLPATELENYCYSSMFSGCTSLTSAPELPATKLADNCYSNMFYGCTSLTSAPKLSAIELARACYCKMFYGCENLLSVTMLAPSDQISKTTNCCLDWLLNAGTSATSRTLKVMDADAYTALESNLPAIWKKGAAGTTVLNEDNGEIK